MEKKAEILPEKEGKKKIKKNTWKFWLIFWLASVVLLFGWYVFLQVKNRNIENLKPLAKILPVGSERRNELQVLTDIYQKAGGFNREQTFLILFQNDMELRPGGGFIGSFGILKTKNGKVSDIQIHDTGNFDGRIPETETPPYPMGEMLYIKSWKLRDSNWSPDFKTNAEKAEYFYKLGQGGENFDGVVAVNTNVLNSFLSITGPVKINDYPGEYNDETAILQLEYQVEKGYRDQGIDKGERKSVMKEMAEVLIEKAHNFTLSQQLELGKKMEEHLKQKDIQMYFKDESLEAEAENMNWTGKVRDYSGDYLMVVDANLNSLKSDICIKRKAEYSVDMNGENPKAKLTLTYEHTCRAKDWMTTNYNDWARVYVPAGSWLETSSIPGQEMRFSDELGKKVFGFPVNVQIGKTESVTLEYNLPADLKNKAYSLLVQKQSGSGEIDFTAKMQKTDGTTGELNEKLTGDKVLSF
ncbi:MAG: DUF4012 domain-containing protein [Parcubacteria group bacterium]|jgi:hypothetical protein